MSQAADLLQARAEVLKLARLLGREPAQLAYLERLAPADLRRLRESVTETLYGADDRALRKIAAASKLLPSALTATLGERAFGPLLSARLAALLDLDRAVDVAGRLPAPFLADVAGELDPRRTTELIARISPRLIGSITGELNARADYVTMGSFVGHLSDAAITEALHQMDDAALLQVAFVIEDKSQLGRLVGKLPRARIAGIIAAADADGLWVEALDLLNHLNAPQRRLMVTATLDLGEDSLEAILDTVLANDLWPEVLLIAEHDEALQAGLVQRLRKLPAARRRAIAENARAGGALERLGVLGEALAGA